MDIRPRIAIIVPGIGKPHFPHKVDILVSNMRSFLKCDNWQTVRFFVCVYDDSRLPDQLLSRPDFVEFRSRGQLNENMSRLFRPSLFENFDEVAIILDDVELVGNTIDWGKVMHIKKTSDLDIISPAMETPGMTHWTHMNHERYLRPNCVTFLSKCELFCYVMSVRAYRRFFQFVDPSNPGMWGLDLVLESHMNLRSGVLNGLTMKHHYADNNAESRGKKTRDADAFLRKLGTSWEEALSKPAIKYRQCVL